MSSVYSNRSSIRSQVFRFSRQGSNNAQLPACLLVIVNAPNAMLITPSSTCLHICVMWFVPHLFLEVAITYHLLAQAQDAMSSRLRGCSLLLSSRRPCR